MTRPVLDQAEGLRRLLGKPAVRTITLISGNKGVGKTNAVVNVATALAKSGKQVVVLDENVDQYNVNAVLGLRARYDLLHVLNRDRSLDDVVVFSSEDVMVLPAARAAQALPKLNESQQKRLSECFDKLVSSADIILVDSAAGQGSQLASFSCATQEIVVVVNPEAASITNAYALIKKMHLRYATQHFRVLVNKVANESEARLIFSNMAQVASDYLNVSLEFEGFVPPDPKLSQSTRLCRTVVEAFPASDSAARFRSIANRMTQLPQLIDGGLQNFIQRVVQNNRLAGANFTL